MGLLLNMAELKCVFIAWLIHVTKKNFGLVLWTLYIVGVELFLSDAFSFHQTFANF